MKQPTFYGRELLPLSVIEAARAGDPLTVESVLRYYDGYMNKTVYPDTLRSGRFASCEGG